MIGGVKDDHSATKLIEKLGEKVLSTLKCQYAADHQSHQSKKVSSESRCDEHCKLLLFGF